MESSAYEAATVAYRRLTVPEERYRLTEEWLNKALESAESVPIYVTTLTDMGPFPVYSLLPLAKCV